MSAPRLTRYQDLNDRGQRVPAIWQGAADQVFVVMSPGRFAGQRYNVGDVLICRGDVVEDEAMVLMARGHGRPRMGSLRGDALYGEVGEPCSAARWRAAGRIVAVLRGESSSLSVVRSAPQVVKVSREPRRPRRVRTPQLSLFSRAA
ncbi:MAG: hypothetical protein KC912_16810 [Proteobacteria bacterium]|nr:hypothetical protein [Pseudomonadota bacterium]